MNKSETVQRLAVALLNAQRKMGNALKDAKNPFFKSKYADLNSVREAVMPALNEAGVSVLQLTVTENGKSFVRTMLLHETGEFITSDTEIVVGKQNDPQALGSAISYARRYGLQSMMCVGAEDNDAEGAMNRPSAPAPVKAPAPAPKEAVVVAQKEEAPKKVSFSRKALAQPESAAVEDDI